MMVLLVGEQRPINEIENTAATRMNDVGVCRFMPLVSMNKCKQGRPADQKSSRLKVV